MDGHRDALKDDPLARDIESALRVEPSPQFVARVRARVAREPLGATGVMSWRLWLGGAAVVAGALALVVSLGGPRDMRVSDSTPSTATSPPVLEASRGPSIATEPVLPQPLVAAPVQRVTRRAVARIEPEETRTNDVGLPQVLIADDEKRGFELLVTELRDTKRAAAVAEATRGLTTPGPPWLEIAPVIIEPLREVGIAQGEAQ
jgi:hypothetical protein